MAEPSNGEKLPDGAVVQADATGTVEPEQNAAPTAAQPANPAEDAEPLDWRAELARVQAEKDELEDQYNGLLEKLTHMRTTVGERLRQDAEELDRREQQIERLTIQISDFDTANTKLKEELVASHADGERLTEENDKLRAEIAKSAAQDDSAEYNRLEARCREMQDTMESQRIDLERWENAYREERSWREDLEAHVQRTESTLHDAKEREAQLQTSVDQEKQVARQLQQALEEFQLGTYTCADRSTRARRSPHGRRDAGPGRQGGVGARVPQVAPACDGIRTRGCAGCGKEVQ